MKLLNWLIQKIAKKHIKSERDKKNKSAQLANTTVSPVNGTDFKSSSEIINIPKVYKILQRPSIRNQSTIGSCASHAAIRAYEIQAMKEKRYIEGSELYHYYVVRHNISLTGDKDSGMCIRDACKGLDKYGMSIEYAWPYNIVKYNTKPSWVAFSIANLYKIECYERMSTMEDIKKSIAEDIPVICGVFLDSQFYSIDKNKGVEWKPNFKKAMGGHAQCIYGYDDLYFYIDNSWGTTFADKGSYKILISSFEKVYFDAFRIIIRKI